MLSYVNIFDINESYWHRPSHGCKICAMCDGVHTCDIVNEWLCSYREVKPIHKSLRYLINIDKVVPPDEMTTEAHAMLSLWRDPTHDTLTLDGRNASYTLGNHGLNGSFDVLQMNRSRRILDALMLSCKEMMTSHTAYDYCVVHSK